MKTAFIGLGHMGAPMSRNILAAGHDLVVHDLRPGAAAGLVADGAAWAGSPREAGAAREAVITMLPGPPTVEQALLGPGGLLAGRPAALGLTAPLGVSAPPRPSMPPSLSAPQE